MEVKTAIHQISLARREGRVTEVHCGSRGKLPFGRRRGMGHGIVGEDVDVALVDGHLVTPSLTGLFETRQ